MILLESYRFRQHVRRQIFELFPKFVLEEIVRDGMKEVVEAERVQPYFRSQSPEEIPRGGR